MARGLVIAKRSNLLVEHATRICNLRYALGCLNNMRHGKILCKPNEHAYNEYA